ncbi:hypothetical protein LTR78_001541 [Recurvomyces mirabilis]|uniref:Zn(2)-C6 fungal-type domain-containing protein n=1 Tax=Recurvomyces mirabilis TaxID=574656 RepID=A0AAE1C509_9PEZI|nr:hypothetical protein LTR78_001541 [Recurvomyces mirabilis]KAK5151887.1 hypothetical protein LTS14_009021 [Recurvomyces mirabilis]
MDQVTPHEQRGSETKDTPRPKTTRKRVRLSRGKGLRTKAGCTACRKKHLKCGEQRPQCVACHRAGLECIYTGPANGTTNHGRVASRTPHHITGLAGSNNSDHGRATGDGRTLQSSSQPEAEMSRSSVKAVYAASSLREVIEIKSSRNGAGGPIRSCLEDSTAPAAFAYPSVVDQPPEFCQEEEDTAQIYLPGEDDYSFQETSPGSQWSGWPYITAEAASLRYFGMLATDAAEGVLISPILPQVSALLDIANVPQASATTAVSVSCLAETVITLDGTYVSSDTVTLTDLEVALLEHFVHHLSLWIDLTDPERSFATIVPSMALQNQGLMSAILALSSRHMSLKVSSSPSIIPFDLPRNTAVEYYNATLRYLQHAMKDALYLRSDELLATVLIISTYEMIDGSGSGWERHLKGVFYIQRSQTIHGESTGLKKAIWWAWLRQDVWAALKERRKILSFYKLTRKCAELDFWGLVNRSVFLLGQCINYASDTETASGKIVIQTRISRGNALCNDLAEWHAFFSFHDRRLPVTSQQQGPIKAIWINPSAASLAVQVHALARLLLLECMPALGGMKEIAQRKNDFEKARDAVIGIAMRTTDPAAVMISTMCLYATGINTEKVEVRTIILDLLREHQRTTGWPSNDMAVELEQTWSESEGTKYFT